MNEALFYRSFEENFYAPRGVIKTLRTQYLPYVQPLTALYPGTSTFDAGCGRGEWLELMQEAGFKSLGVDMDAGMLQACVERGLPALQGDAIAHLLTLPNDSQAVVSAFHVVEHIAFDQLHALVVEALRVLKPGGLLIMETPNPENIAVATRNFYLDPTHIKPLPPMLLGYLPKFHGFARVATVRLQEPSDIHTRDDITLTDVLHHVSPDYAVIAQKRAAADVMAEFDGVFAQTLGVDLHNLANRFDARQSQLMTAHHETRQALLATQGQVSRELGQLQAQAQAFREELHAMQTSFASTQAEYAAMQQERDGLRQERDALRDERDALRNSLSWKVTAPLRGVGSFAASPVSFTLQQVLKHPRLSERVNGVVSRFPGLHARLRGNAIAQGLMQEPALNPGTAAPDTLADLSPRARSILASLQQEIARLKV